MKQKTQILNQFESLLYTANPELITFCKSGVPAWLLKLLQQYPTAAKLTKTKVTSVARIPYIPASRARELIDRAKKSISPPVSPWIYSLSHNKGVVIGMGGTLP